MITKKNISITLVIFILMINIANVFGVEKLTDINNVVCIEEALKIADKYINAYTDNYINLNLSFNFQFYDADDSVLGYYISFQSDSNDGYIIISATRERPPVLEYSEGNRDHEFTETKLGKKAYYLNAFNIIYANNTKDLERQFNDSKINYKTKIKNELNRLDKKSALFTELENELRRIESFKLQPAPKGNYKSLWSSLDEENENFSILTVQQRKELTIEWLHQRMPGVTWPSSACGPTVGAMIANYYNAKNPLIRGSSFYGGHANFINHLWNQMATLWGTSMSSYNQKMADHFNINYANNPWIFRQEINKTFNNYKNEIDMDRPVGLRFFQSSVADFSYHWVVGSGYEINSISGNMILCKDPDGHSSTRKITWDVNYLHFAMSFINM